METDALREVMAVFEEEFQTINVKLDAILADSKTEHAHVLQELSNKADYAVLAQENRVRYWGLICLAGLTVGGVEAQSFFALFTDRITGHDFLLLQLAVILSATIAASIGSVYYYKMKHLEEKERERR